MTSYLIDINVWMALTWGDHPQASVATRWYESVSEDSRFLFCRITQLGLLRLLANEKVMGTAVMNIGNALATYDQWLEDPSVEFVGEGVGLEPAFRLPSNDMRASQRRKL